MKVSVVSPSSLHTYFRPIMEHPPEAEATSDKS